MTEVNIIYTSDHTDCETCGVNYGEGIQVVVNGETVLEVEPIAHCFDATQVPELPEILESILKALGHKDVCIREEFFEADYSEQIIDLEELFDDINIQEKDLKGKL